MEKKTFYVYQRGQRGHIMEIFRSFHCLIPFYLCLSSLACFTAPPNPQLWQFPTLAVWNAKVSIQPSFEESKLQRPAGIAVIPVALFQYRRSIWACNEIRTKLNHLRCSKANTSIDRNLEWHWGSSLFSVLHGVSAFDVWILVHKLIGTKLLETEGWGSYIPLSNAIGHPDWR